MAIPRYECHIDVPASRIVDAMSKPGWLSRMHPFVKEHESGEDPAPGCMGHQDRVVYYSGVVLHRTVCGDSNDNLSVSVEAMLGDQVIAKIKTTMALNDVGKGCDCVITIDRELPFSEEELELQMQYLDQMMKGFSYYLTTGKPVQKNQFGSHPLYSP